MKKFILLTIAMLVGNSTAYAVPQGAWILIKRETVLINGSPAIAWLRGPLDATTYNRFLKMRELPSSIPGNGTLWSYSVNSDDTYWYTVESRSLLTDQNSFGYISDAFKQFKLPCNNPTIVCTHGMNF